MANIEVLREISDIVDEFNIEEGVIDLGKKRMFLPDLGGYNILFRILSGNKYFREGVKKDSKPHFWYKDWKFEYTS